MESRTVHNASSPSRRTSSKHHILLVNYETLALLMDQVNVLAKISLTMHSHATNRTRHSQTSKHITGLRGGNDHWRRNCWSQRQIIIDIHRCWNLIRRREMFTVQMSVQLLLPVSSSELHQANRALHGDVPSCDACPKVPTSRGER